MVQENGKNIHFKLVQKGVVIDSPESVYIDHSVDAERIEPGAIIHAGSRISGKQTLICSGAAVGAETPATVENCLLGPDVSLKGGFFKKGVFLESASVGSGGHVREGTIFEEYASAAHTAGVKQTILFPFVTLGSLINFCDCFMAGGTGAKNHSEVGSSYIHFNFTPQQDKITPSLLGDVPKGVMLNCKPIFLGGHGGIVGPVRLAYGTVVAAGTICRSDELREGRLIFGGPSKSGNIPYSLEFYRNIKNITVKNLNYIANLIALLNWYEHVRPRFVSARLPHMLLRGLLDNVDSAIKERVSKLMAFAEKMERSASAYKQNAGSKASGKLLEQKRQLYEVRNRLEDNIMAAAENCNGKQSLKNLFLQAIDRKLDSHGKTGYVNTIQKLGQDDAGYGTAWLASIIDESMGRWMHLLSAFREK